MSNPEFRRTIDHDPIPGWELPATWDVERYAGTLPKGIPREGLLRFDYVCDDDELDLREDLALKFTLAGVPRPTQSALEAATLLS